MTVCSTGQNAAHGLQAAGTRLRAEPQRAVLRTLGPHLIPFTACVRSVRSHEKFSHRKTDRERGRLWVCPAAGGYFSNSILRSIQQWT